MVTEPQWPDDYLTREDAAQVFQVSIITLKRMAQRGMLHNYRRGPLRTIWLLRSELEAAFRMRIVVPEEDEPEKE